MSLGGLKQFWEDVRAGRRPRPTRTSDRRTHKLRVQLDGTFGSDRGRRINLVIYSNGVIELRLSKSPRKEVIHASGRITVRRALPGESGAPGEGAPQESEEGPAARAKQDRSGPSGVSSTERRSHERETQTSQLC